MVLFLRPRNNVLERNADPRRQQLHFGSSSQFWLLAYALIATTIVLFRETRNLVSFTLQQDEAMNNAEAGMMMRMMLPNNIMTTPAGWDPLNPLAIPAGQAQNLPSIRVETNKDDSNVVDHRRKFYGGAGDQKHLGGFTDIDLDGISPAVWKHMIQVYGVHSVLDVGCGRGISTLWFVQHGLDQTLCVEGSHDAVVHQSVLPPQHVIEHDFSRGPWWPANTYDAVWSVEFLEHVGVQYQFNYLTAFRKAALIFVTTSRHGGWHHTEVHDDAWWIRKYQAYGLVYSPNMTEEVRTVARQERSKKEMAPNGGLYNAVHVWLTMKVFVNPVVAALPQHAHLFPEHGCFARMEKDRKRVNRECGTGRGGELETPLPKSFHPLSLTPEMDQAWEKQVRKHVKQLNATKTTK